MKEAIIKYNKELSELKNLTIESYPSCNLDDLFPDNIFAISNDDETIDSESIAKYFLRELDVLNKMTPQIKDPDFSQERWESLLIRTGESCLRFRKAIAIARSGLDAAKNTTNPSPPPRRNLNMDESIKKYNEKLAELMAFSKKTFPDLNVKVLFDRKVFKVSTKDGEDIVSKKFRELERLQRNLIVYHNSTCDKETWKNLVAKCKERSLLITTINECIQITKDYLKTHKKDADKIRFCMPTLANNDLRKIKYDLFISLMHTLKPKINDDPEAIKSDFIAKLQEIHNNPNITIHRDPTWKRYLKNIAGVLFFGVAPIYSKVKFNTFCFWRTESERAIDMLLSQVPLKPQNNVTPAL